MVPQSMVHGKSIYGLLTMDYGQERGGRDAEGSYGVIHGGICFSQSAIGVREQLYG